MVEVGMAIQKVYRQGFRLGIIKYMLHPYCFSSNGISVKSSRYVRYILSGYMVFSIQSLLQDKQVSTPPILLYHSHNQQATCMK